jgi:hypothetical protein
MSGDFFLCFVFFFFFSLFCSPFGTFLLISFVLKNAPQEQKLTQLEEYNEWLYFKKNQEKLTQITQLAGPTKAAGAAHSAQPVYDASQDPLYSGINAACLCFIVFGFLFSFSFFSFFFFFFSDFFKTGKLTSSMSDLKPASVFVLMQGVLTVGEDFEFLETMKKVERSEQQIPSTYEEMLRLGMLYHQVALHFAGDLVKDMPQKALACFKAMEGHPLGEYVDVMLKVATASSNLVMTKDEAYEEELQELAEAHGECYFAEYVNGLVDWKKTV